MFTLSIEFKNGSREFVYGLNRVECNTLIEKYSNDTGVSYVGVLDENF